MTAHFPPSQWSLSADEWERLTAEQDADPELVAMFPDPPADAPRRLWQAETKVNEALFALNDLAGALTPSHSREVNRLLTGAVTTLLDARAILTGEDTATERRAA